MLLTHALALSAIIVIFFMPYVHSVRIELAKFISVGTRITYQATGDAEYMSGKIVTSCFRIHMKTLYICERSACCS